MAEKLAVSSELERSIPHQNVHVQTDIRLRCCAMIKLYDDGRLIELPTSKFG